MICLRTILNPKIKMKWSSLKKFVQDIKKFQKNMEQKLKGVYYITRDEPFPSLHENADFSIDMIKASIKDGELKASQILKDIKTKKKKYNTV
jgi:hypothetical protein